MQSKTGLLLAASLLAVAGNPTAAIADHHETPVAATETMQPAPLSQLVASVDIPYESFTLDNGLRVLVHTDHTTPVVAFSVWYGVGSRNEPAGKTGFAHLFEHLMFYGSENAPEGIFPPLSAAGATDMNGTTSFDRTNYFETVPTGALDRVLMLESDRMGHLLGAVTQDKLDTQVGVVQNERRQNYENSPFGMTWFEIFGTVYPEGHPYHHLPIGSMEDIGSASLDDVQGWFHDHYGPNNAVIALAGDVDLATAKAKMNAWFGAIPRGPAVEPVQSPVPTLAKPVEKTMTDKIATTRIAKYWATPARDNPDSIALELTAKVLGGLKSSRLDDSLVRGKNLAVSVGADADSMMGAGLFEVTADVAPGVEAAMLRRSLDADLASFLAKGPTADELDRAKTQYAAGLIRGLDQLGGSSGIAPTLASGLLFDGDPESYKRRLAAAVAMTPKQVRDAARKWLGRPAFALTVVPEEAAGGKTEAAAEASLAPTDPTIANFRTAGEATAAAPAVASRASIPAIFESGTVDFPDIEKATLSNGMKVYFARSTSVPTVSLQLIFEGGTSADPSDRLGQQALMLNLMDEGTRTLDAQQFAVAQEILGASIGSGLGWDETIFSLQALKPNLLPSLSLFADYVRNPGMRAADLERVRTQQITAIDDEMNDAGSLARRAIYPLIYGPTHPYAAPTSGNGRTGSVKALSLDDLKAAHATWLRPDTAEIFAVGDTTLDELTASLETSFGAWAAPDTAPPIRDIDSATPAPQGRIVVIDRPGSAQSYIRGGHVLAMTGNSPELFDLQAATSVYGEGLIGRQDKNLRDGKGWSYGGGAIVTSPEGRSSFITIISVQTDRTADSMVEILKELKGISSDKPISAAELQTVVDQETLSLPGQYETNGGVLAGMVDIVRHERPEDYVETLPARYKALGVEPLNALARTNLDPTDMVFVVVGDAARIVPQFEKAKLPVEVKTIDELYETAK